MTGKRELIKTAFIKSLPIMCSYIFVSMAYGITMEEHGLAWVLLASDKRDRIHRCVPVRTYHISEQRSVDTDDSGDSVFDEQPAEFLQPDVP